MMNELNIINNQNKYNEILLKKYYKNCNFWETQINIFLYKKFWPSFMLFSLTNQNFKIFVFLFKIYLYQILNFIILENSKSHLII